MPNVKVHSLFTEFDINLFKSGKHYRLYEKLGSHLIEIDGVKGTYFSVWAPSAKSVSVIGNFNAWNADEHKLIILVRFSLTTMIFGQKRQILLQDFASIHLTPLQ